MTFCIRSYSIADSYFITKDKRVVQIENIILNSENETLLLAREFTSYDSFYYYPLDSKLLNIFVLNKLSQELDTWTLECIMAKVMLFPFNGNDGKWVCFPIIHTL